MAQHHVFIAVIGLAVVGGVTWYALDRPSIGPGVATTPAAQVAPHVATQAGWQIPATGGSAAAKVAIKDSPLLPMAAYEPAATSMADTRERGDARTPPIEHTPDREAPDAWTMQDPDRYAQYEAGQNAKIYGQYVSAADAELPKLRAAIEAARNQGMVPEQIAVGEEKLRQLTAAREMAASLLQAQHGKKP
ncbi:MAG: hypothetical protein JO142_03280 [Burkholderiales bacterium]|nr:hypothetical protein [Burkholderiales bacterium]